MWLLNIYSVESMTKELNLKILFNLNENSYVWLLAAIWDIGLHNFLSGENRSVTYFCLVFQMVTEC